MNSFQVSGNDLNECKAFWDMLKDFIYVFELDYNCISPKNGKKDDNTVILKSTWTWQDVKDFF